jgi:hypothetical protein
LYNAASVQIDTKVKQFIAIGSRIADLHTDGSLHLLNSDGTDNTALGVSRFSMVAETQLVSLNNGNFVAADPGANNNRGAVYLFTSGAGTMLGDLTGANPGDQVGLNGITLVGRGNFLIDSTAWNGFAGAVTWSSGTAGVSGVVSPSNSLTGTRPNDRVGSGITRLSNGDYIVASPYWDDNVGAITWGSGNKGVAGSVSSSNSLLGSQLQIGPVSSVFQGWNNAQHFMNQVDPAVVLAGSNLYQIVPSAAPRILASNVNSFGIGSNGDILTLDVNGNLTDSFTNGKGETTSVRQAGVESFGIAGKGDVIVLTTQGRLLDLPDLRAPKDAQVIGQDIVSFGVAGNGDVVMRDALGNVYDQYSLHVPGASKLIGSNMKSLAIAGNGDPIMLNTPGYVYDQYNPRVPGASRLIGSSVATLAIAGNGDPIMLNGPGDVYDQFNTRVNGASILIGSSVRTLAIAGNGDPIMLNAPGNVYDQYNTRVNGDSTLIGSSVTTLGIAGDGDPIMLNTPGNVYDQYNTRVQGASTLIGNSVTAMAIAGNGDPIMLNTPGNVYDQYNTRVNGASTLIGNSVTAVAIAGNGDPIMLNTLGRIYDQYNTRVNGDSTLLKLSSLSKTSWTLGQPGFSGAVAVNIAATGALSVSGLPPGLRYTSSGNAMTLLGTPTQTGTFTPVVTWSVPGVPWAKLSSTYSLVIDPTATLGGLSVGQWTVGQPGYTASISISGGTPAFGNLVVTNLPPGLTAAVSGRTVTIGGTPARVGTSTNVTIGIRDGAGATVSRTYSITINPPATLSNLSVTQWTANEPSYPGTILISGGTPGYALVSILGLPPGLSGALSGNAITFTGVPTQASTFSNIVVTVADGAGARVSGVYSLTLMPALSLTLTSNALIAVAGQRYAAPIIATGGFGGYVFSLTSGSLPLGLSLDAAGNITGTTTATGNYFFTVTAVDPQAMTTGTLNCVLSVYSG